MSDVPPIRVVARDITFMPDPPRPAVFVSWREVPVGAVAPLDAVPGLKQANTAQAKKALREKFKPLLGLWHATSADVGYFNTMERAAEELVRYWVQNPASAADRSPTLQAAMREAAAEQAAEVAGASE